jgi:hypothetical protein
MCYYVCKYLENITSGIDLFWLVVSEMSGHGQLAPLLWAGGEAEHHGGRSKFSHLMVTRKQRETGRDRDKVYLSRTRPQ